MTPRPYLQSSIGDLTAIAKENWGSVQALQAVLGELLHRTTARAQRLERDIAARVLALGGEIDLGPVARAAKAQDHAGSAPDASREASLQLIAELKMRALVAEQQCRELAEHLATARAEIEHFRNGSAGGEDAGYAAIGLHRSCPDFVFEAVRRAFRKEYHPDSLSDRPKSEQLAAQEIFKEYEQLFRQLQARRQ